MFIDIFHLQKSKTYPITTPENRFDFWMSYGGQDLPETIYNVVYAEIYLYD